MADLVPPELAALGDQQAIRERVTGIVMRMLDEFEDQLDRATPQAKRELLKSAIPAMMKSLETVDQTNAEIAELRGLVTQVFDQVRGGLLGTLPIDTTGSEK